VDQLLTPRGLVLTLASFGGVVLIRFDSGREVVVGGWALFFLSGVFVLFWALFFLCGST